MQTKKHLWITTMIIAGIYLLSVLLSVALIRYGAHLERNNVFLRGAMLLYLWILNPIPLVLSVIGLIRDKERRLIYCAAIVLTSLAWLVGGMLIAPYF